MSSGAAFADFIEKWRPSAAAERANKDSFLNDLCGVLGVPAPDPTTGDAKRDHYVFEKAVQVSTEKGKTTKFIDLYKRGHFVIEAKQGSQSSTGKLGTAKRDTPTWNVAMNAAFGQAIDYASALDQPPPFVIVTDIGYCFDVYASFDGTTRYRPFPNALSHRFFLTRIAERADTLRSIFTDPLSLDPTKIAVEVTREVAAHLADLTRRLEKAGHAPQAVADFLMRCIFTMFAEDVGLLPEEMFTSELRDHWIKSPRSFTQGVENLWRAMNDGSVFGFFGKLLHFNGGLFKSPAALPLDKGDLEVLLEAASCRWNRVEPAIFGALFEGALDKKERHSLGAHFTPRAYVERLVRATIEEPVREDWSATQDKIRVLASNNKIKEAKIEVRAFMKRLSEIRVLDPACGSGNFLYVALDLLKAIEDEAFALLLALEGGQTELCLDASEVTPRQFLGIEINPRAKAIAELVLWIGYLQWHFRAKHRGGKPREPVLEDYKNIEHRDGVLAYDSTDLERDKRTGKPISRWDGETMKKHPVTGELVPDERFTSPVYTYSNPRMAEWPNARFVVGNPPFIGNKRMRELLGDEYVAALRNEHASIPESADYVMYWWDRAAELVATGKAERSGLITTNSIVQGFNRRVVEKHISGDALRTRLVYAVPDHPWVDASNGAQVRIAMTVIALGSGPGVLEVIRERLSGDEQTAVDLSSRVGPINPDLSIGVNTTHLEPLLANVGLACPGVQLSGQGFVLSKDQLSGFSPETRKALIKRYVTGRDLTQARREQWVLDTGMLSEQELRDRYPEAYQWLYSRVRPERLAKRGKTKDSIEYATNWWRFSKPRPLFRRALAGLDSFIVTSRTARHRVFQRMSDAFLPETKVLILAIDDSFLFGVVSSRVHVVFANAMGGWLGVGNDSTYNHSECFNTFPFPSASLEEKRRIAKASEAVDQHRNERQAKHPALTITAMYNVLEKLKSGEQLTDKERQTHEAGLVSVLLRLHEELDELVLATYGWSHDLTNEEILARLVSLNAERVKEEKASHIRWLRPELQKAASLVLEAVESEEEVLLTRPSRKGPGIKSTRPEAPKVRRKSTAKR